MATGVSLTARDLSLLRFLLKTPATTALLFRISSCFDGEAFGNERRLRERLQALEEHGFVRSWTSAHAGGGLQKYFKLSPAGFRYLSGPEAPFPPRAFFSEVSPSLFEHTFRLAEVIGTMVKAARQDGVRVENFIRENELTFQVGSDQVLPDCFFRLRACGKYFNLAFEVDQGSESLDSLAFNSVKKKLQVYQTYHDELLDQWRLRGKTWERPRFRLIFLTRTVERAYHILDLASKLSRHPSRRLCYAAALESFVIDSRPLHAPLFLDHFGCWQSLVDLHPTAPYAKSPVRWTHQVETPFVVC